MQEVSNTTRLTVVSEHVSLLAALFAGAEHVLLTEHVDLTPFSVAPSTIPGLVGQTGSLSPILRSLRVRPTLIP